MLDCYLHIGTEKTGTTTLQAFLAANRDALADRGIATTTALGGANAWWLAVAAYDDDRHDDLTATAGVDDASSRDRFRDQVVAALVDEVADRAAAGCDTVVLSSEHLHSRLTTSSELARLREVLARAGLERPTAVVHLRDPIDLAASLFSTLVKHGARSIHPPLPNDPYVAHVCDHRATVTRWEEVFGPSGLITRLFTADDLVGGSIVDDVLSVVGVERTDAMVDGDATLNRSLSAAEIGVLARLNELLPYTADDGSFNPIRAGLVPWLEDRSCGTPYRMPPERADRYRRAYAASNDWVRAARFPDRVELFPARPTVDTASGLDPASPSAPSATMAAQDLDGVALWLAELWVERQRAAGVVVDQDSVDRLALARSVLASGLWDAEYYLTANPDVDRHGAAPLGHFLRHGGAEGRNPSPRFDTAAYLARHPELAKSGENPLVHHLRSTGMV